jgi:hypothetical protein
VTEPYLKAAGCTEAEELTWCEAAPKPKLWSPAHGVCRCPGKAHFTSGIQPSLSLYSPLC